MFRKIIVRKSAISKKKTTVQYLQLVSVEIRYNLIRSQFSMHKAGQNRSYENVLRHALSSHSSFT